MRRPPALLLTVVAALAASGACGTTDDEEAVPAGSTGLPADCGDVESVPGPIEVRDAFGRTVRLDDAPRRVAVLEWQQVEDVVTLCVAPVAVADVEGYRRWSTAVELPEGVQDVGERGEPNLDALFAAEPDLVVVEATSADDPAVRTLSARGIPVLGTKGADAADPVAQMLDTFELIGAALGRTARADQVVEEFEAHLREATGEVGAAARRDFVYLDGYVAGGNVSLRPFGQGSLVGELGEALGLRNVWSGPVDEAYGLGQTDIEGMTAVGDASIYYTGTIDPDSEDVMALLEANPIWRSLPAVAEGRAHAFPPGVWTFGGPRSSMQVIDAFVVAAAG